MSLLRLKPIDELIFVAATCKTVSLDMMWHLGRMSSDAQRPRPNWSGFMLDTSVPLSSYSPVSDIQMLPLIDLNPDDLSCIFSTLHFIKEQAPRLNMKTACVTFDQPLWLKATDTVQSHNMNVVSPQRISCCCELQWQHWQVDGGFGSYMSLLDDADTDSDNSDGSSMQHAIEDSLSATQR